MGAAVPSRRNALLLERMADDRASVSSHADRGRLHDDKKSRAAKKAAERKREAVRTEGRCGPERRHVCRRLHPGRAWLPLSVVHAAGLGGCDCGGLLLLAYGMYAEVLRENAFLSRTVEVQQEQRVIDTGLYGVVRHPMYAATLLLFLSIPLVLGSLPAFFVFLMYPVIIVKRIRGEEQLLEKELPGYQDYQARVKYRLIPFIW